MDNLFVTVLLIVGIVILAIPQSVSKTIKKLCPVLLLFVAVFGGAFFVQTQLDTNVKIIATGTKDKKAEGTEIFIKKVIINGKSESPVGIFSSGWIEKDGGLIWRDYDQSDNMKDNVYANFKNGDDVTLVLKKNKWQGKARIISTQGDQEFNGYIDSESDEWMTFDIKISSNTFITRKTLLPLAIIAWSVLALISLACVKFFPEKKRVIKDRIIGLDVLKILSASMIILIHSSANLYNNHEVGTLAWKGGLILNVIPRFAVPAFLMISGALLLGRKTDQQKAIKKAVYAGIALAIWSISYVIAKKIVWNDGDVIYDILKLPFKIGPSGHLWYGYLLVWIYLFSPVLNSFYESLTEKMRIYFILFGLVAPGVIDGIITYFSIDGVILESPTFIYLNLGYISIMFLGRVVYENREKLSLLYAVGAVIIGFLTTYALSYGISEKLGSSVHTFFYEVQISNVLYGIGVMLFACKIKAKNSDGFIKKIIIKLSELSLGIYFSHSLLMWVIGENIYIGDLHLDIGNSVAECLLFVAIIFVGTIIMIAPLANIPYLKKLVKIS